MTIVSMNELDSVDIDDYSTIGFAYGIYYWTFHKSIIKLIDELDLSNKNVFFVYTCGLKIKQYDKPLINKIINQGANYCGTFGCRGYDTYSILKTIGGISKRRPNQTALVKERQFIRNFNL